MLTQLQQLQTQLNNNFLKNYLSNPSNRRGFLFDMNFIFVYVLLMDLTKIFVVVEKVFELCFSELCYEIILDGKIIVIKINNVNPQPVYNPMDFETAYKMFCKDEKTILTLSKQEFFYPLYSYCFLRGQCNYSIFIHPAIRLLLRYL